MNFKSSDICAVIVTCNCDYNDISKNINALITQVDKLIIVDNNSNENVRKMLLGLNKDKIELVFNQDNFGLAYGLNQAFNIAFKRGYKLLLTMDQDSELLEFAVKEMLEVINKNDIVSVGTIRLKHSQCKLNINTEIKYKLVKYLITSGNLTIISAIHEIGGYNEKLFIDSVDFDFSLRLRQKGYKLAIANNAYMKHEIGETFIRNFCFLKLELSNHSPVRYYYMYRNNHYIITNYFREFPIFCIKKSIFSFLSFMELLFHKERMKKCNMVYKGIIDGFKSKYGKFCE